MPSTDFGSKQSIEGELVRRNREIALIRDQLGQRERELQDWKNRHSELVVRLADVDGELTKTRAQARRGECHREGAAVPALAEELPCNILEQVGQAQQQVEAAEQQVEALLIENSGLRREREVLLIENNGLRREREEAETAVGEAQAEIGDFKQQIEALQREAESLRIERYEAQTACQEVHATLGQARQQAEALLRETQDLRRENQRLQSACEEAQAGLGNAKQQVEILQQKTEDLCRERQEAESGLSQAKQQVEALLREAEGLRREKQQALTACEEAQASFGDAKEQVEVLQRQNEGMRHDHQKAHNELDQAKRLTEALLQEAEVLRHERRMAQDACQEGFVEAKQQMETLSSEVEDLRNERQEAETARGKAQAELLEVKQHMDSLLSALEMQTADGKGFEGGVRSPCGKSGGGDPSDTQSPVAYAQSPAEDRGDPFVSEMEELERLNSVLVAQTGRLKNAKIHQAAELDHSQFMREAESEWRARQEVKAELLKSEVENRFRAEAQEAQLRVAALEEELARRPPACRSPQMDSRMRVLQTENNALRSEVNTLRRQGQELYEGLGMLEEETRTRQLEAAYVNSQLRIQLEETRRTRQLEMNALVTKMCVDRPPCANKLATGVAC